MLNQQWTHLSDQELDDRVTHIKVTFPNVGETMLGGILRSQGIFIQRERVRCSLHRTDPINTALRWGNLLRRQPYSVPGPNALWHIDGNHKLIRWRMVTSDSLLFK